jgi:hypothetical protein
MAAYFLLVMGDAPSFWLNNLPVGSIMSWADLSQAFTSNFQASYNHPGNAFNLERVTMKVGERLRDYTNRFFENHNTCIGVRDDHVIESYKKGLRDRNFFEKIHESGATKVVPLMEVVNKLIDTEEALVNQFDHDGKHIAGTSGTPGVSSSKFRKQPSEVLVVDGRRPSTFNVEEFNAVLDSPCTFHEGGHPHSPRMPIVQEGVPHARRPEATKKQRGPVIFTVLQNNRRDNQRDRGDNDRRDDRQRDQQPEDRRDEHDLPPPPETGNPNGLFQQAKRLEEQLVHEKVPQGQL